MKKTYPLAVSLVVAAALGIFYSGSAGASYAPFNSNEDVQCTIEYSESYEERIILSKEVFDEYRCRSFGRNGQQFAYSHDCTGYGIAGETHWTCSRTLGVIEASDLDIATKSSTCVQLEYWGNSPHGYDYVPNSDCLQKVGD